MPEMHRMEISSSQGNFQMRMTTVRATATEGAGEEIESAEAAAKGTRKDSVSRLAWSKMQAK